MHAAFGVAAQNMFHLSLPWAEKIVRPWLVYVCLVLLLRLFGKRELAQLNPFDLVVLLCLANTVQNAIIGDDNSVSGGLLGALSLLAANWVVNNLLYRLPRLNAALQGSPSVLVRNGMVVEAVAKAEKLSSEELLTVLNRNGFSHPREVEICVLQPNGSFFVKGKVPTPDDVQRAEILAALKQLTVEVQSLRGAGRS